MNKSTNLRTEELERVRQPRTTTACWIGKCVRSWIINVAVISASGNRHNPAPKACMDTPATNHVLPIPDLRRQRPFSPLEPLGYFQTVANHTSRNIIASSRRTSPAPRFCRASCTPNPRLSRQPDEDPHYDDEQRRNWGKAE
jgi:hypothetical protein